MSGNCQCKLHYQAVGKIGGTGNSSSPGASGSGLFSAGGFVSGPGCGGIDGLKSGSGTVCDSLFISNPVRSKSIIFILFCQVFIAFAHAHPQANEPNTAGRSPMMQTAFDACPTHTKSAGGQNEAGIYKALEPQASQTRSEQASLIPPCRIGWVLGNRRFFCFRLT